MSELTDKQKRFCEEYAIDFNGAQAAIRAGYSENSAKQIASENLTKPDVLNYIKELTSKAKEKLDITKEDLVNELWSIVSGDIDPITQEVQKYAPRDRINAMKLLAQITGLMAPEKHEHTINELPQPVINLHSGAKSVAPKSE